MKPIKLYTHVSGEGPPLVILHGLFGSWENWGSQARQLAEHFTVYAMDVRNHGRSPHTDSMDYPLMAKDVLFTMEEHSLTQATVIGHSMGGKIAMQMALNAPEKVSRLIVVDIAPRAYEPGHNDIFEALCELDLTTIGSRQEADKQARKLIPDVNIRAFVLKNLTREGDGFAWKMNLPSIKANYPSLIDDIGSESQDSPGIYTGQTLFIKGAKSDYIESGDRQRIGQLFPEASAKIIDGAGHWPHAEKPSVFYKIASDFLLADKNAGNKPVDSENKAR